jgi:hypothetical protein
MVFHDERAGKKRIEVKGLALGATEKGHVYSSLFLSL